MTAEIGSPRLALFEPSLMNGLDRDLFLIGQPMKSSDSLPYFIYVSPIQT